MSNNLAGLNKHLFDALDRVGNKDLSGDDLTAEIQRAEAVVKLGGVMVANANTVLKAAELRAEYQGGKALEALPAMLSDKSE